MSDASADAYEYAISDAIVGAHTKVYVWLYVYKDCLCVRAEGG